MEAYLGDIRLFAGNFAPRGWALCDGSLLAIAANDALYSVIGTTYGGDGVVTFALPDLRGRAPVAPGQAGQLGAASGTETVTLLIENMPGHQHGFPCTSASADTGSPVAGRPANARVPTFGTGAPAPMESALLPTGGSQPHENMGPSLAITYIICLEGIFPVRG